ncbi:MAG: DUF1365 domain-containing protein [Planctomycetota bacterium]|nr:DUF1365 domain-containing protein [Planctomycetota bacterium]MCX8040651.1 DUF1365 domain-containing protein [Planctomycetota bacterium]MDW8372794.1 DUF1365 domain-containing protein [Planctomycetota bacterium]
MNRRDPPPAWCYLGWVRHRRYAPVRHAFRYRHGLLGVDADDGRACERHPWFAWRRPAPIRFHRGDYLRPLELPLAEAARRCLAEQTGVRCAGPVELITQPRAWGYSFNPVSFYLCHHADGRLAGIVAEITNTPWLERHAYALAAPPDHRPGRALHAAFAKRFHISPFNGMRQEYRWSFRLSPAHLLIHMRVFETGSLVFDATLACWRRPLSAGSLSRLLMTVPLLNLQVIWRIYFQAWQLWRKRAPFHPHPRTLQPASVP